MGSMGLFKIFQTTQIISESYKTIQYFGRTQLNLCLEFFLSFALAFLFSPLGYGTEKPGYDKGLLTDALF